MKSRVRCGWTLRQDRSKPLHGHLGIWNKESQGEKNLWVFYRLGQKGQLKV